MACIYGDSTAATTALIVIATVDCSDVFVGFEPDPEDEAQWWHQQQSAEWFEARRRAERKQQIVKGTCRVSRRPRQRPGSFG